MIIRETLQVAQIDCINVMRVYDYYSRERKVKVYIQTGRTVALEPFGAGTVCFKGELPELKGEIHNVDEYAFLDAAGDDNRAGRLIDIKFVEVDDE